MSLGLIRTVQKAVTYLNPEEVRRDADYPLAVSLNASSPQAMWAMESYFCPPSLSRSKRDQVLEILHSDRNPDLVIFEAGMPDIPKHAFAFDRDKPEVCIRAILKKRDDLRIVLARHLMPFREPVVNQLIATVAKENALFSVATALPDVVPLISLPWAIGEFATDTAFLTMNQVRLAFLIAAASDHPVGYAEQKAELASILAGAFGFRAIARQLVSKIPLGGGLIPKAAIAYAGTRVVGLSMERLYRTGYGYSQDERNNAYEDAFQKGRVFAGGMVDKLRKR
ncbi:hypothetical protein F183_A26160 [Bryobacterales bacterium F-183]|nr:hypothetical protein F183_A26160 [Bryobacterales bacterium F-183]